MEKIILLAYPIRDIFMIYFLTSSCLFLNTSASSACTPQNPQIRSSSLLNACLHCRSILLPELPPLSLPISGRIILLPSIWV